MFQKERKTWDDTDAIVKKLISDKSGIEGEVEIERVHRVGKKVRPRKSIDTGDNTLFGAFSLVLNA